MDERYRPKPEANKKKGIDRGQFVLGGLATVLAAMLGGKRAKAQTAPDLQVPQEPEDPRPGPFTFLSGGEDLDGKAKLELFGVLRRERLQTEVFDKISEVAVHARKEKVDAYNLDVVSEFTIVVTLQNGRGEITIPIPQNEDAPNRVTDDEFESLSIEELLKKIDPVNTSYTWELSLDPAIMKPLGGSWPAEVLANPKIWISDRTDRSEFTARVQTGSWDDDSSRIWIDMFIDTRTGEITAARTCDPRSFALKSSDFDPWPHQVPQWNATHVYPMREEALKSTSNKEILSRVFDSVVHHFFFKT